MATTTTDIFTNVHMGIRKALFDACVALGRGEGRARLDDALHLIRHHGINEDTLLLPMIAARLPDVHARMTTEHARIEHAIAGLAEAEGRALYLRASAFTALYLEHMREEEDTFEPLIRATLSVDELAIFSRQAVERTAPDDARRMLLLMLPALAPVNAEAFLAKLPVPVAEMLRARLGMSASA